MVDKSVTLIKDNTIGKNKNRRHPGFIIFGWTMIVVAVYLIAYNPAVMSMDSYLQLSQALGKAPLYDWHPALSTLICVGAFACIATVMLIKGPICSALNVAKMTNGGQYIGLGNDIVGTYYYGGKQEETHFSPYCSYLHNNLNRSYSGIYRYIYKKSYFNEREAYADEAFLTLLGIATTKSPLHELFWRTGVWSWFILVASVYMLLK